MKTNKVLLIDESFGTNIPSKFINQNDMLKWNLQGHMEAVNIVKKGIQDEAYWDAWQEILTFAVRTIDGVDYWLDHSSSLYAVKYTTEETLIDCIYDKKGTLKRA